MEKTVTRGFVLDVCVYCITDGAVVTCTSSRRSIMLQVLAWGGRLLLVSFPSCRAIPCRSAEICGRRKHVTVSTFAPKRANEKAGFRIWVGVLLSLWGQRRRTALIHRPELIPPGLPTGMGNAKKTSMRRLADFH